MPKITPYLWFDTNAEEALNFYQSVFKNSETKNHQYWKAGGPMPEGLLLTATIVIDGQEFHVLNGGPMYKFTPAISFFINCSNQEEVDYYWEKLTEGGQEQPCGWLVDKFGVSWQIVPGILEKLLWDKDPVKSQSVMNAMLRMVKLDIAALEKAYNME